MMSAMTVYDWHIRGWWMDERRGELDLTLDEVAARAGVSTETFRQAANGRRMRTNNKKKIERALGWEYGSIDAIDAGDPPIKLSEQEVQRRKPEPSRYPADLRDDPVERKLWDIKDLDERSRWRHIYAHRTEAELARKIAQQQPPLQPPGESTQTEQFG